MSSGIQGVRRWDVVDADGHPASLLIGHTGEGLVAVAVAAEGADATFVLLDRNIQVRFAMELQAAMSRAEGETS